jgi:hypothetical protein
MEKLKKEINTTRLGSVFAQLDFQLNSDKIRLTEKQLDFLTYFVVYGDKGRDKAVSKEHHLTSNKRVWYNQMSTLLKKKVLFKKFDKLYLDPSIVINTGPMELTLKITVRDEEEFAPKIEKEKEKEKKVNGLS